MEIRIVVDAEIDADTWAAEYGIEASAVAADITDYFQGAGEVIAQALLTGQKVTVIVGPDTSLPERDRNSSTGQRLLGAVEAPDAADEAAPTRGMMSHKPGTVIGHPGGHQIVVGTPEDGILRTLKALLLAQRLNPDESYDTHKGRMVKLTRVEWGIREGRVKGLLMALQALRQGNDLVNGAPGESDNLRSQLSSEAFTDHKAQLAAEAEHG